MSKRTTAELLERASDDTGANWHDLAYTLADRLDTAEATIARVEGLVEKWLKADKILSCQKGYDDCANELKQALENE